MNFGRSRSRSRKKSLSVISCSEKWKSFKIGGIRHDSRENDSDEDVVTVGDLREWVEEFFLRKSVCDTQDQDVEVKLTRKQTLILSTLVPDEVLLMKDFDELTPKRFVGVLLMADVSGYTALSEKYNNYGKTGTYRLTATLNKYMGSLTEVVYSYGGDIIKFAGDAFLALWKLDKRSFLCQTIHTAIACALVIQHAFGSFETDVKVNLKVKLAISAGNLIFAPIGSGTDMSYVIVGLPVLEAKNAESVCASGEVKLAPTAWGHCYSRNYVHVIDSDGYVTVKAILYDPNETNVTKPFLGFPAMLRQVNKRQTMTYDLSDFLFDSSKKSNTNPTERSKLLNLRKTILLGEEKKIGSEIRKFMVRPVLTQIDAHQPLEYLTEMRQVSVMFLTLKPQECPYLQLVTVVNNSYKITCEIVYKSMGCVNKIILFDKDIMILVIFGLRGFKHESEAQAALKCAYSVKKSISALDGVLEVSAGVTTGKVYCGVVGHPLRREFTVIGAIVNKAARLMCCYRNKITCDEATYLSSKLSTNGFTLQAPIELKGIIQAGKIYEYSEDIRLKHLFDVAIIPPLLNRDDEMKYYTNWLNSRGSSFRDIDALLLIGESRVGKSRLLDWMMRYAKNNAIRTCYVNLTSVHSSTPYLALSQIVNQMLDINEPTNGFEKEQKIINVMKYYTEDLCYLNTILKVRYAYHEGTPVAEYDQKEKTKHIFTNFIKALPHDYAIFIDDLQNLDEFSWEFISIILSELKIFTVLAVTRGKFVSVRPWFYTIYLMSNIQKIILSPLNSEWIPALACQMLDVVGVPKDLCNTLISKCNGMPGQVETFILHLFSCGALACIKINKEDKATYEEDLYFPDSRQIQFLALDNKDQTTLEESILRNTGTDVPICLVEDKAELDTDFNVINLDALIMIQLDSLTPYQQLLLKIASVIGDIFSRDLLENIMYENDFLITAKAIKRLFSMRIISCANIKRRRKFSNYRGSIVSDAYKENISCECGFDYDPSLWDNLPKYAFCKVLKFKNRNSRKTFYELLPLNQKKEFHIRIINYFENNKQKCFSCGGGITIVHSDIGLLVNEYYLNNKTLLKNGTTGVETHTYSNISKQNTSEEKDRNALAYPGHNLHTYTQGILDVVLEQENLEDQQDRHLIFDYTREVIEAQTTSDWCAIGIVDSEDAINDNKNNMPYPRIKLAQDVTQSDFKKCTCIELYIIIYKQLIHHAKEAGLFKKVIEFLIRFSYLNIYANTPDDIVTKLEEAEDICQNHSSIDLTKYERNIYLGKIYTLKANSHLIFGKYMAAKIEIEKALKIYGAYLTKLRDLFKVKNIISAIHFKRKKFQEQADKMKSDFVFCLNVATSLYSAIDDESLVRTTAQRALLLSHTVKCDTIDLLDAFCNIIDLASGQDAVIMNAEKIAKNTLLRIQRPVQSYELFAVGKFYTSLYAAHTARAQLILAIRSGYQALVLSQFLGVTHISIDIIPNLFYLLLSRCRIAEAVKIVKLLQCMETSEETYACQTWYNALCLDLILDAGFHLESPEDIYDFTLSILNKDRYLGPGRRRLVLNIWTYCLRTDERKSKRFENEALSEMMKGNDTITLITLISSMRLAEGMLESLARKVDDLCKIVDLMELRSLAEKELNRLEDDVLNIRTIYPRWLLLKAHSLSLSGRTNAAASLFNQAKAVALQSKNRLEEALARAATLKSQVWLSNARNGCFLNCHTDTEYAKSSWQNYLYRINGSIYPHKEYNRITTKR